MSIESQIESQKSKTKTPPRILVVDDDPQMLGVLVLILEKKGYEVLQAHNALSAISTIVRKIPDLIITDIGIPIVDGLLLVRELKASADTAAIPVLAITGMDAEEYRDAALQAGCSAFLTKPVNPESLVATVAELIENAKMKPK